MARLIKAWKAVDGRMFDDEKTALLYEADATFDNTMDELGIDEDSAMYIRRSFHEISEAYQLYVEQVTAAEENSPEENDVEQP